MNTNTSSLNFIHWIYPIMIIFISLSYILQADPPDTDANKDILKQFIEQVYNNRALDKINDFLIGNYVSHTNGKDIPSSESVKQNLVKIEQDYPDYRISIEDMIAESDKVVLRYIFTGKSVQNNKIVKYHGIYIAKLSNGKLIEGWHVYDNYSINLQLCN